MAIFAEVAEKECIIISGVTLWVTVGFWPDDDSTLTLFNRDLFICYAGLHPSIDFVISTLAMRTPLNGSTLSKCVFHRTIERC